MRTILCLAFLFCSLTPVSADEQTANWQLLKSESIQLRQSEPTFALLKLHQAWDILSKKNSDLAVKELQDDVAKTYGVLYPSAERNCGKLSAEQFRAFMNTDQFPDQWQSWTITKKENSLLLNTSINPLGRSSGHKDRLLYVKPASESDQKKFATMMPIVIPSSDAKYKDLLAMAEPIKNGEKKAVNFDLNPFVPKEFQNLTMP